MNKHLKRVLGFCMAVLLVSSMTSCGYERIDAGCEGIKVNLYGSKKGVQDITSVTGAVWYNSFTTKIYEFPTYNQRVVWTKDDKEGSVNNEEFTMTAKDGLPASFDVSLNYSVKRDKVVTIFKNYRKNLDELNGTVLRDFVRKGFKESVQKYTAEELFSKAALFQKDAEKIIKDMLEKEGFTVNQVSIIGKIRLPLSVEEGIQDKVKAKQNSLKTTQEIETAKANAKITEENAKGLYKAAVWERKANEEKTKGLTDRILREKQIIEWGKNGAKVPTKLTILGNGKNNAPYLLNLK